MPEFHSIINPVDVTGPMEEVIAFILYIFKFCFDFLKSFEFAGTNLLSISITFVLISLSLPIVIGLTRSGSGAVFRTVRKDIREGRVDDTNKEG